MGPRMITDKNGCFVAMERGNAPDDKMNAPTRILTNGRVSDDTRTILYEYDATRYTTEDIHAALETAYPEFYWDWTAHGGEVHLFKHRTRWNRWLSLTDAEREAYERKWAGVRAMVGRTC